MEPTKVCSYCHGTGSTDACIECQKCGGIGVSNFAGLPSYCFQRIRRSDGAVMAEGITINLAGSMQEAIDKALDMLDYEERRRFDLRLDVIGSRK